MKEIVSGLLEARRSVRFTISASAGVAISVFIAVLIKNDWNVNAAVESVATFGWYQMISYGLVSGTIAAVWEALAEKTATIHKPAGSGLNAIARFLLPPRVYERIVVQIILDAREDINAALAAGEFKRARWLQFLLPVQVVGSLVAEAFSSTIAKVLLKMKAPKL